MYEYRAYGLNIHSEIYLPELIMSESSKADVLIRRGKVNPFSGEALNRGPSSRETKNAKYRFWDDIGQFKISNGTEIVVQPAKEVDDLLLRMFIIGTIFANLLNQRGFLVLHASAVNINNSAVAFLGDQNQGKSTTALEFYKKGYPIIADDYIPIHFENNVPFTYSGFPQLKLSIESLKTSGFTSKDMNNSLKYGKSYFPAERSFEQTKLPLTHIYTLKRDFKNSISSSKPQNSFIELTRNNYGIRRYKSSDSKRCFLQCDNLIRKVQIKQLKVSELGNLNEIVSLVEKDIFNAI